ncbi:MAG: PilN domain-containing protein [Desulfobacterales bacterium]|nr:PilN domain-containing protein [Desulfobacterales bacterium]
MSKTTLGLEIKDNGITAVLLKTGLKGTVIEAHKFIAFENTEDFESSLKIVFDELETSFDLKGCSLAVALPPDDITYRNLSVPFKEERKIRQMLPFELESKLLLQAEDIEIDFYALKSFENKENTDIVTCAISKEKLKFYFDFFDAYNIVPEIITSKGYSTALAFSRISDFSENHLFLDIDKEKAILCFSFSKQICIIRSLKMPSSDKIKFICSSIRQAIDYFEEVFGVEFNVENLVITGSGIENSIHSEKEIEESLGIKVKKLDLINHVNIRVKLDDTSSWNPCLMDGALALALIENETIEGLNFQKKTFAFKKIWEEHKSDFIKTGIVGLFAIILLFINIIFDINSLNSEFLKEQKQINEIVKLTFPEINKIVDSVQQVKIKLKELKEKNLLNQELVNNVFAIDILNEISQKIPKTINVEISRLVIGPEGVQLSGVTDTYNSIDEIKGKIERSDIFKKVIISSATAGKNGIDFKLKIDI